MAPEGVCEGVDPRVGVPSRSTPSLAAFMIALPNVEGSKRVGRLEVLRVAALERFPIPDAMVGPPTPPALMPVTARGDSNADVCGSFSFRGEARWAWNSSKR